MAVWNYADVWETIAGAQPERAALVQGERVVTWAGFDRQADALAAALVGSGLTHQSKVACYLFNAPEYLVTVFAAFKAGLVPFNVNYRYASEELFYLLDNADCEAVVFHAEFADRIAAIRERSPKIKAWYAVPRFGHPVPEWAQDYDHVVSRPAPPRHQAPWGRSGEDLLIIYTGGTTGLPKGVMWRQQDVWGAGKYGANPALGIPPLDSPEQAGARALASRNPVSLIAPPLMHATGLMGAIYALSMGGTAAFLVSRKFDPVELWNEVERLRVSRISGVGMAFFTPMLETLDANPGRWDLSSVLVIGSSGAMWNVENKRGLLRHMPQVALMDSFASSEAFGMGASTMTAAGESPTAKFLLGDNAAVFTEDGRRVQPGSGERGRSAVGGFIPLGYYNDPKKTAETFPTLEGRRWSMPGDWATVEADGTVTLLGRGNQCINTGGEKVFP
ncbi:MAG: CoA synthetase, long-chain fatty acid:CoA ligase, partial [Caulobacteraceae bacterium]|nr:CoA synthetase, long-chain fatty acid:CoA ligase [Caulobacteraceae bacterium]